MANETQSSENSCPDCQLCFFHCTTYRSAHHIPDSVVPSHCTQGADSNFSWLTLPPQLVVKKSKLPTTGVGVFPSSYIPAGTIFGPLVGQAYKASDDYVDLPYTYWKFKDGKPLYRIDCSDNRHSNWMRWVNTARRAQDITAIVCECGGEIYFRTVIKLNEDMELLIGSVEDDLKVPIKGDCCAMLSADEILDELSKLTRTVDHKDLDKIDNMLHDSELMSIEKSDPNDMLEPNTSHTDRANNLEGWELKVVKRLSGQSLGKYDIYYYSPTKEKFRSRIQLQKYIESKNLDLNLDLFSFSIKSLKTMGCLNDPHKWPYKLNLATKSMLFPVSHSVPVQKKTLHPIFRLQSFKRNKTQQNVPIQKKTLQPNFRLRSFKKNKCNQNKLKKKSLTVQTQKKKSQPNFQLKSLKKNETGQNDLEVQERKCAINLKGWRVKIVKRLSGRNAGKYDVYYFSPSDKRFRSRLQLQKYLKSKNVDIDLEQLTFHLKSLVSMCQSEKPDRWPSGVSAMH